MENEISQGNRNPMRKKTSHGNESQYTRNNDMRDKRRSLRKAIVDPVTVTASHQSIDHRLLPLLHEVIRKESALSSLEQLSSTLLTATRAEPSLLTGSLPIGSSDAHEDGG